MDELEIKKKEQLTKNYYDGIAKGYKELYHNEQIKKINLIKHHFPKEGKIIDLGAGDGVLNHFLSKNIQLISLDISKELLKLNPNKKENKILASILDMPFEKETFDFAFSFTAVQDTQDPKKAFGEVCRILKNNGRFIISFLKISNKSQIIIETIKQNFKIITKIEEEKDFIYVLEKK